MPKAQSTTTRQSGVILCEILRLFSVLSPPGDSRDRGTARTCTESTKCSEDRSHHQRELGRLLQGRRDPRAAVAPARCMGRTAATPDGIPLRATSASAPV